jgi:hypothetical protein
MMMIMMKRIMKIRLSRAEWEAFHVSHGIHISHERNSKRICDITFFSSFLFWLVMSPADCLTDLTNYMIRIWLNYHQITSKLYLFGTKLYDHGFLHKRRQKNSFIPKATTAAMRNIFFLCVSKNSKID